jgi:leucyl/phenylalanyl-tRNA--protein transferase
MPVYRLGPGCVFPSPEDADPSGLLAVGGDLTPERLLVAYAMGIFPWFDDDQPILWHSPNPRHVLLPSDLVVSRSLRRFLARNPFTLTLDVAFSEVIRACAAAPRKGQDGTWITGDMIDAYQRLHEMGFAHSVEAWEEGELVGGLYGLSLGGCFFGESMFTRRDDASKAAFVALVHQLSEWNFDLIDCQVHTDHLTRFGARPWRRRDFLAALETSLTRPTLCGRWRFELECGSGVHLEDAPTNEQRKETQ